MKWLVHVVVLMCDGLLRYFRGWNEIKNDVVGHIRPICDGACPPYGKHVLNHIMGGWTRPGLIIFQSYHM